jgi:prephenate dehydrogenase
MKKEIAIIGYGRFGRLAARYLKRDFRICIADTRPNVRTEPGVRKVSLSEAAGKKFIILAVPIGKLAPVLRSLAPLLSPGTTICDVCSVKEQPIAWMKTILPRHTTLLGTHPLFGPDSAATLLQGRRIVLCPVRISPERLRRISRYLERLGLTVTRMSARKHDSLMASSLFLTQFIGRTLMRLDLPPADISTANYRRLSEIASTTGHDSLELLDDMYRYNRFAWKTPRLLAGELKKLERELSRASRHTRPSS